MTTINVKPPAGMWWTVQMVNDDHAILPGYAVLLHGPGEKTEYVDGGFFRAARYKTIRYDDLVWEYEQIRPPHGFPTSDLGQISQTLLDKTAREVLNKWNERMKRERLRKENESLVGKE
jgi:hypothetical protein